MPTRSPARLLAGLLLAFALTAAACGGGGGDAPERGDPNRFTMWVPNNLSREMDQIVRLFKQNQPGIEVEAITGSALDFNDRLLLGERPDVYVGTASQIDTHVDDKTLPDDMYDLGTNPLLIVVSAGNPKQITDVAVFGLDPTTNVGLCRQDISCGKAARSVLMNAGLTATPDSNEPDARTLLNKVANGTLDAGMLYRTETAKPEREGRVTTITTPTSVTAEVVYRLAIVTRGDAVDAFINYLDHSSGVDKVLENAGLAPVSPPAP